MVFAADTACWHPVDPVKSSSSSGQVGKVIRVLHYSVPPCLRGESLPTFLMHTLSCLSWLDSCVFGGRNRYRRTGHTHPKECGRHCTQNPLGFGPLLHPAGVAAHSRWSSAATPPVHVPRRLPYPEGIPADRQSQRRGGLQSLRDKSFWRTERRGQSAEAGFTPVGLRTGHLRKMATTAHATLRLGVGVQALACPGAA